MGFTNLHSFSPLGFPFTTNSDGAHPQAGLVLSGNMLYGAAALGGNVGNGYGTIFAINTNGTGFTNIFYFHATDGAYPYSDLLLVGSTLYGTTSSGVGSGGSDNAGTVFQINTDGSGFNKLYGFPVPNYSGSAYTNSTGAEPWAGVVLSGNNLFGVTPTGGTGGVGTVYVLTLPIIVSPSPIPVDFQVTGGALVLSWTNAAFSLQSASIVTGIYNTVSGAVSPYTVPPTNSQQFFRLQAN